MQYIINGDGYRTDIHKKDDVGGHIAVLLFCHVYSLTCTILGFTSLLRVIRLAIRKMPGTLRAFLLFGWLLVPFFIIFSACHGFPIDWWSTQCRIFRPLEICRKNIRR